MSVNQSWGGRFSASQTDTARAFTTSERFDRKLYRQDIRASKAHAAMLASQGIISRDDVSRIIAGLDQVQAEIESGQFVWRRELEDVHMNIESRLTELVGESGKKLHTGRSRNDQVGLTFRLYVSESCQAWQALALRLCDELLKIARAHTDTIMPGFTHMQPAQPVSLAQYMLAYAGMFRRDCERLVNSQERCRVSPLGAAALAGSTYPLNPAQVAADVGFPRIYANSMDAVSDRDYVLEALFNASLMAMHLSRLCEEIILWATPAFGFVKLPDAYSTGSSIMPQKKNPDVAELARGKAGRVYGNLMAMLTVLKGLPLAYNSDLQEDKEAFFDTDETIQANLAIMAAMLPELAFQPAAMLAACKKGFLNATELADYLVTKGAPFREAHHLAGSLVAYAEKACKGLEDLELVEMQAVSPLIQADIYDVLGYQTCVARRETPGGTGPNSVRKQLEDFQEWLDGMAGSM